MFELLSTDVNHVCTIFMKLANFLHELKFQSSDDLVSLSKAVAPSISPPPHHLGFSCLHSQSVHLPISIRSAFDPAAPLLKKICLIKRGITLAFSTYCLLHLIWPFILNLE